MLKPPCGVVFVRGRAEPMRVRHYRGAAVSREALSREDGLNDQGPLKRGP